MAQKETRLSAAGGSPPLPHPLGQGCLGSPPHGQRVPRDYAGRVLGAPAMGLPEGRAPHSPRPPCSGWCPGSRSPRRGPGKQRRALSASQNPPPPAPAGTAAGSERGAGTSSTPPATPRPHRTTAVPLSSARLRRRRPISVTLAKSPRARSSRSSACPVAPEAPSTKQDPAPLPPPPAAAMSEGSAVLQAAPCCAVLPAAFPARPCSVLLPAVLPGSRPAERWLCHLHVMLGMSVPEAGPSSWGSPCPPL